MEEKDRRKEASRRKALGELGELFAFKALVDKGFVKIKNLNDISMNKAYADIYAEDESGKKYVISVKARNKYRKDGDLNAYYNLFYDGGIEKAFSTAKEFDAEIYWLAIPFDSETYSVYFGSLGSLKGSNTIPIKKCESGLVGEILVHEKRHYFDWDFFSNK